MPDTLQRETVAGTAPPPYYAVLHDISWATYEALLTDSQESAGVRFFYDQGTLEIMTPLSPKHERTSWHLQRIVETVASEWDMDLINLCHTTMRRADLQKGFEADASFYLRNPDKIRRKDEIDLPSDPPPDLVLEVEVSRSALDKLAIYSGVGVPEVWRSDGQRVAIHILQGDRYLESSTSLALAGLTTEVLSGFLTAAPVSKHREWILSIQEWARAQRPVK